MLRDGTLVNNDHDRYSDGDLSAASLYCYTIVAYDNAGNNSSASSPACARDFRRIGQICGAFPTWHDGCDFHFHHLNGRTTRITKLDPNPAGQRLTALM